MRVRADKELCTDRKHAFKVDGAEAYFFAVEFDEDSALGTNFCDFDDVNAEISVWVRVYVDFVFGQRALYNFRVFAPKRFGFKAEYPAKPVWEEECKETYNICRLYQAVDAAMHNVDFVVIFFAEINLPRGACDVCLDTEQSPYAAFFAAFFHQCLKHRVLFRLYTAKPLAVPVVGDCDFFKPRAFCRVDNLLDCAFAVAVIRMCVVIAEDVHNASTLFQTLWLLVFVITLF